MTSHHPMTLTGKILKHHAINHDRGWVETGDVLRVRVDWTIASELAFNGMNRTYEALGRPRLHDPERFYLALDHTVDPETLAGDQRTQRLCQISREFARAHQIRHFYEANTTIMHTTFYRDLVCPGDLVLGADSHTSSHGGLGAFAIGLGGADVTIAMVLGESWIEVPEAIAIHYGGGLPFGLGGKDIILKTLGILGRNSVALERSVEYSGDALLQFSADTRFTICNMTAEFGGLNGIFAADPTIGQYVQSRANAEYRGGRYSAADADAPYVDRFSINLGALVPQLAKPYSPDNVVDVDRAQGQTLDGTFIGACTTTEEELVLGGLLLETMLGAGEMVRANQGRRIVVPGNLEIEKRLTERGLIAAYRNAGFIVRPPGCSMCLGIASDRAAEGETWLSSQNRNFHNRMGKGSHAWLASAATVACSSLSMTITDPRPWLSRLDQGRYQKLLGRSVPPLPEIGDRLPSDLGGASQPLEKPNTAAGTAPIRNVRRAAAIRGRIQRFGDHVDTDAIIPGEFCHLTEPSALGERCFFHVRPEFRERARSGQTIVVAGHGWGSGSSREQAVWALQGAGIQIVVARSCAYIHKRNLVNDALPLLQVDDDAFFAAAEEDVELEIDLDHGEIRVVALDQRFLARPPSGMVSAISRAGGIIAAVRFHGPDAFARLQRR
jgi:aconitate hydratase/homoaconitate hydratase